MTTADRSANDFPWLRVGLDVWCFGLETSMLAIRALRTISEAQLRALPNRAESRALVVTTLATSVDAATQALEPMQGGQELLAAVLPRDEPDGEARDPMYSGSRDVVPWRYNK